MADEMTAQQKRCKAFNALPDDLKGMLGSVAGASAFHPIVAEFLITIADIHRRIARNERRRASRARPTAQEGKEDA